MPRAYRHVDFFGDDTRYLWIENGEVHYESWDGSVGLAGVPLELVEAAIADGTYEEVDMDNAEDQLEYANAYIRKLLEDQKVEEDYEDEDNDSGIRIFSIDEVADGALEEYFGTFED